MKQLKLKVVDDEILRGFSWEIENPKGNIVIMEGMEEHVSRYDEMAKFFNANGYSVYGLDTYGQGENVNKNLANIGYWPHEGFAKQVTANDTLVKSLAKSKVPTYIFAHSMGAFMGQDYIERFPGNVKKIVLCGSGSKNVGVPIAKFFSNIFVTKKNYYKKSKILNKIMFGNFNNKIKNPRTAFDWLSHNEKVVDTYIADPLCGFGPNCGFCHQFLIGMSRLYKKQALERIDKNQEIFIITGSEDPVTNYGKSTLALKKMYNSLGINDVETKVFEGLRHEIHNEDRKEEVFNSVLEFFNK